MVPVRSAAAPKALEPNHLVPPTHRRESTQTGQKLRLLLC